MDKKYINIDDLVRQRLSGAEESESHSAWLRMSELLDEPKRKKPGIFFWRNTLGAVSALVLLGLAGAGSYKVSSYAHRNAESRQMVASAMNGRTSADATITAIRKGVGAANATSGSQAKHIANTVLAKNNTHQPATTHEDAHMQVNNAPEFNSTNGTKTVFLKNDNTTADNTTTSTKNNKVTAHYNASRKEAVADNTEKATHRLVPAATGDTKSAAEPVFTAAADLPGNNSSQPLAAGIAQPVGDNNHQPVNDGKPAGNSGVPAPGKTSGSKLVVAAHAPATAATKAHISAPKATAAKGAMKETAATNSEDNTSITARLIAEVIAASKNKAETKAEHSTTSAAEKKNIAENATTAQTGEAKPTGNTTAHKEPHGSKTIGGKHTEQGVKEMPLASSGAPAKGARKASTPAQDATELPVTVARERKVVNKLLLRETYIKTAPNDGYFKLDTISMEMLVKEQPEVEGNNTTATAKASKKNLNAAGNNETNAGAETPADPNVLAAAKEESASQKAAEAKEKPVVKKTISAAEKLSLAFNDIKSNIRGMQFAPGLTGGINGTFFGPSGYRGFQFGVTGELIYSDNLSVKGELKYFNRLNGNDFSLQDDYFTYTASGGQYVKTQQTHSLSFASVQSVELPISVRYTSGRFTFFAGENTTYSFAVNASESTLAASTSTTVATKGADNAPTVRESDFGSRFGVGYLFGMSYLVAPNFTLDLRSVQTVWDNSSSSGAKAVSSQLYKHPSFQLSIGYRFSAKKSED